MSSQEAYEAEMKARKDDLIREEQEAKEREREREKARERAKKSRKGKYRKAAPAEASARSRRRLMTWTTCSTSRRRRRRAARRRRKSLNYQWNAAVQARAQWLEDRTRMSLALHPQFRIGALSIFRLGEKRLRPATLASIPQTGSSR